MHSRNVWFPEIILLLSIVAHSSMIFLHFSPFQKMLTPFLLYNIWKSFILWTMYATFSLLNVGNVWTLPWIFSLWSVAWKCSPCCNMGQAWHSSFIIHFYDSLFTFKINLFNRVLYIDKKLGCRLFVFLFTLPSFTYPSFFAVSFFLYFTSTHYIVYILLAT